MHRKSKTNDALIALGAAVVIGVFAAVLGAAPWVVIMLMAIVVIGAWLTAANGMSGNP